MLLIFLSQLLNAQNLAQQPGNTITEDMFVSAAKIQGTINIDGQLTESEWTVAPILDGFIQLYPNPGEHPSEETTVQVLYDDNYLYIGMRLFDSDPDQIVANLGRKDDFQLHSDWAYIVIDSNNDRRTAYRFQVNPAGVRRDGLFVNDNQQDNNWRGVWEAATHIDSYGWTAEFKIPFSQLGISNRRNEPFDIGINFGREIARYDERSFWAPIDPESGRFVSHSGYLRNLDLESAQVGLEVVPYMLSSLESSPFSDTNPLINSPDASINGGLDIRYRLSNTLTLNATLNPDFGQVEVDPAVVNLTAFQDFFPEQRPFFTDQSNIFMFARGRGALKLIRTNNMQGNMSLFYSRRIGRKPQGNPISDVDFTDTPATTQILGALKLAGRSSNGWSLGIINATTNRMTGSVYFNNEQSTFLAEPITNYSVLRLSKDYRDSATEIGLISTAAVRENLSSAGINFPKNSISFGVDFRHRFASNYELLSWTAISHVQGTHEYILRLQRAPGRYFQRPDASHITINPDRTSLLGTASHVSLAKISGGGWRYGFSVHSRSPEFEINDMGFVNDTDAIETGSWLGFINYHPTRIIRQWNTFINFHSIWSFGGEHLELGGNINGAVNFQNNWRVVSAFQHNRYGFDVNSLRGGSGVKTNPMSIFILDIFSDNRKIINGSISSHYRTEHETDGKAILFFPNIEIRPSTWFSIRTGPRFQKIVNPWQWVGGGTFENGDTGYIVGKVDQKIFAMDVRLSFTIIPELNFDLYLQPLANDNSFSSFRYLNDPRALDFEERFVQFNKSNVSKDNGMIEFNTEGSGSLTLQSPDFSAISLRGNAVLRWEFRPGSEIYIVWQQNRSHFGTLFENFTPGNIYSRISDIQPQNNILFKINYWFGV
jgi:hypothetical protein